METIESSAFLFESFNTLPGNGVKVALLVVAALLLVVAAVARGKYCSRSGGCHGLVVVDNGCGRWLWLMGLKREIVKQIFPRVIPIFSPDLEIFSLAFPYLALQPARFILGTHPWSKSHGCMV